MNGDLHFSGHVEQANNAVPFDGPDVDGAATFQGIRLWIGNATTSSLVTDETIRGSINTHPGFPGVIGGNANYNGVLPPDPGAARAPMSGGGGYIGWNAEPGTPGEADWFNTYPGQNGNADGHAFWVVNNGAWTQAGGFTRGGRIYAPHGARVMPIGSNTIVDGLTGTCPANATFTFVGCILTGCR